MSQQPEAPTKPTAWLVHAQYPFVTMDPPIEGGLLRTELFTREQIATELRRLHAENERLRAAVEFAAHKLVSTRVWNGSGWTYNHLRPMHYTEALDRLRAAIKEFPQ